MGQIVKRKRKGRPPKSDLARRELPEEAELDSRVRRSLRRRNVRYNFVDYDDFIDDEYSKPEDEEDEDEEEEEEEEEEDGEEERREKKVKLVVKLSQGARVGHSRGGGSSDEEDDEDDEDGRRRRRRKVVKRRRIGGRSREDEEEEVEEEEEEEEEEEIEQLHSMDDADEERRLLVKGNSKEHDSLPGTPPRTAASSVPLPDKKKIELILDKLQKKDTYGVYAEPVDPDELPDYHDVIEHPMDFSTVRKKLANGLYSALEQFESDVLLICSNAMLYNAPDTIYHKQARTIQELGRKKFQKLRNDYERAEREHKLEHKAKGDFDSSEKELKFEQRTKSSPLVKKHVKKPASRPFPEPVGSDFSAGATLAGEPHNVPASDQAGNHEMPGITDGVLESSPFPAENSLEKGEELSTGKGSSTKFWRKPSTVDENRRATYNMSTQPILRVESIFTAYDSEMKQLVAVGLHAENSYARSLARFAATLGPMAWKVASERIEEVLPSGSKYGRGWVGEYEPLPTPILPPEKSSVKDYFFMTNSHRKVDSRKDFKAPAPPRDDPAGNFASAARPGPFYKNNVSPAVNSSGLRVNVAATANHQQPQSPLSRNLSGSSRKVVKQFELNSLPPASQCNADYLAEKKHADNSDMGALRPGQSASKNLNHSRREVSVPEVVSARSKEMAVNSISSPQSAPFKQLDRSGSVARGLSNGNIVSNGFDNSKVNSPSNGLPSEMQQPPGFFLRQNQGLSDPVQLMRMLAEKAQMEQNPQKLSGDNTPVAAPPVPSNRKDTSGNAATAAASVWMSIGGGGFRQGAENSSSPRNQTPTTDPPYSSPREGRDPVHSMRMLSEKAQRQQHPYKHSADSTPAVAPPVPSIRRDTSGNAATAAASAWMSIGGGGGGFKQATENSFSPRNQIPTTTDAPYSSHGEMHPSQMARMQGQFPASSGASYPQRERGSTLPPPFMQQQIPVGLNSEAQFSNRPTVFPQLMMANLARFQAQTPWRGISPHTQQRAKQDTLPPDLNIGFQAPGSPVMQSSGVKMEQQPDLALQL